MENKENKNNKKSKKTIVIIYAFTILVILAILVVGYLTQKQKFDNDLNNVCSEIFEKEELTGLKTFISSLKYNNQKEKVYNELKIKLQKNADDNINNYEKSHKMLNVLEEELTNNSKNNSDELNNVLSFGKNLYTYNVCLINGDIATGNGEYYRAYRVYENGKKTISSIDEQKAQRIEKKQEDIYDKAKEDAKSFLTDKINSSEIDKYVSQSVVKAYIEIVQDEELTELYNEWNKKNEIRKNEESAKEKEKEKERKKQQGVRIGMSKQDVLDSNWGEPIKINKSTYSWGTTEQWVYPNYNYLYFENGKLTSIQTNE